MLQLNINSRLILPEHKIWLVYAGKRRRFFDIFSENSCVFLEHPALQLTTRALESEGEIRRRLRASDAVLRWVRGATDTPPTRSLLSYSTNPPSSTEKGRRAFNAEVGNIIRMFRTVAPGDLIICPPMGHYEPMLIGEVVDEWKSDQSFEIELLGSEAVPYRRVKWIRRDLPRRSLPPTVGRALQNPHAISEVRNDHREAIYQAVYEQYAFGDHSKVDLVGDQYSGKDPTETNDAAKLIKYTLSALNADQTGNLKQFSSMNIDDAINRFYSRDLVIDLSQNFNSPGKFKLTIKGAVNALVVSSFIGAIVLNVPFDDIINNMNINADSIIILGEASAEATSITQSGIEISPKPETPSDVANDVRDRITRLVDGIGRDGVSTLQDGIGRNAKDQINFHTPSTIEENTP